MKSFINEYFDGVYCVNLDRRPDRWNAVSLEFEKFGIIVERISAVDGTNIEQQGLRIRPNEMGCLLSHRSILERMIANKMNRVLIFEDDIYFTTDPNAALTVVVPHMPPDWDMLYLGGNHVRTPAKYGSIWKCSRTFTTSSYAINRGFAEKMLEKLGIGSMQVDVEYSETHLRGNSFCIRPSIVRQLPGYSDIQDSFIDYDDHVKW